MAKKTFVAQNKICGLEPPKAGKSGNVIEHVLDIGAECVMDEDDARPYVDSGSLAQKSDVVKPDKAAAATEA